MSTVTLATGFPVKRDGEDCRLKVVTLRLLTAGDLFDAQAESEQVIRTPDGWQLLTSDHLLSLHTLRRQIVSIDDHPGPLSIKELRTLEAHDLDLILRGADAQQQAMLQELKARGRPEAESGSD